jgi:hypothetical protein
VSALFRKVANRRHWDDRQWLAPDDVQADALKDLETKENVLSIYIVEDSDVDRLIAALATTADYVSVFDYAVAPEDVVSELSAKSEPTVGNTPDGEVNQWHRDLEELGAAKLVRLVQLIKSHGQVKRCTEARVHAIIKVSVEAGYIDKTRLNERIAASLRKRGVI